VPEDSSDPPNETAASEDVVVICGATEDRGGVAVIRAREGQLEAGAMRPLQQGKPITGEVVRLKPRKECPLVCDVDVELAAPALREVETANAAHRRGPAQVASDAYRRNWDAIYKPN
jgi:hypothetical protein